MDLELTGKTALVTGASRGIGKAIAGVLAGEGVDVALVARASDGLEQAAADIRAATGTHAMAVPADTGEARFGRRSPTLLAPSATSTFW
jgi:short-subunit dehydrogenase